MESQPVDLVRATLEQAWQAECASDIYLARQVVDLRGLLAEARARENATHVRLAEFAEIWTSLTPDRRTAIRRQSEDLYNAMGASATVVSLGRRR